MRYFIAVGIVGFFATTTTSFAVGLSEGDYEDLAGQKVEWSSALLRDLSPREQATLHAIIGDIRTANDPDARVKSVNDALAVYREH